MGGALVTRDSGVKRALADLAGALLPLSVRDLQAEVHAGRFREDLFYRLNVVNIHLPDLRTRREDIPLLAEHFLNSRTFQRQMTKQLSEAAIEALSGYSWPGNIRELRNVIERAILISGDRPLIEIADLGLPPENESRNTTLSSPQCELRFDHEPTLDEIKENYLLRLLGMHHGHRGRIANILGISERNAYRMIKRFGLEDNSHSK